MPTKTQCVLVNEGHGPLSTNKEKPRLDEPRDSSLSRMSTQTQCERVNKAHGPLLKGSRHKKPGHQTPGAKDSDCTEASKTSKIPNCEPS